MAKREIGSGDDRTRDRRAGADIRKIANGEHSETDPAELFKIIAKEILALHRKIDAASKQR
jgi:hypothetical protein